MTLTNAELEPADDPCVVSPQDVFRNRLPALLRPCGCIIILCVFTTACTTTFFYRHMDWLLIRFVEGYVKLDEPQKQHVRADLNRVTAALEHGLLPDLQAMLDRLAEDNRRGVMAANLDHYMQQVEILYKRAARLAEPGISTLALSLDDEQKKQLFQEFARRDEKFVRKYIARGEEHARERHFRTLRKNVRKWIGSIGPEQGLALQTYDENYQANEQRWLKSRQYWQAELKRVLDRDASDAKSARLTKLLLQPQNTWSPDYRNVAEQNRGVGVALTRQLADQLNDNQRVKFARQLVKNQQRVDSFARAIATTKRPETAGPQASLSAAKAALPPASLAHKADNH